MLPKPSRPISGSGDAVCGRLEPEPDWLVLEFDWPDVAPELGVVLPAPLLPVVLWSVEVVLGVL
jgi:hypothetical protein